MLKNILILGATSTIARYTAMAFAQEGHTLYLAGRDQTELDKIAQDIRIRFETPVFSSCFELDKTFLYPNFLQTVLTRLPQIDGVVWAIGTMSGSVETVLAVNFHYAIAFLNLMTDYFKQKKSGFIIAITSVAGDRGRQSNYIYGAAKGGLGIYLDGLRHKLYRQYGNHIRVITIKPGFVDTAMTFGLKPIFLVSSPKIIGRSIADTLKQPRKSVFYSPWFWAYIMLIIRHIPDWIFKKLPL